MQKNSNRKGLALGAAFALVASLFVAAPAQAAAVDGANIGAYPAAGTTFTGVLVSDFNVYTQLKPGSANSAFNSDNLVYKIEKTAGTNMDVIVSASAAVSDLSNATSQSSRVHLNAGVLSNTSSALVSTGGASFLNVKAHSTSDVASWSPVTLKVTAWIDNQGGTKNDVVDVDEWRTTFTITLIQPTSLAATTTVGQPVQGDTSLTVSSVVSGANLANIRGSFALALSTSGAASFSGGVTTLVANPLSASAVALRAGIVSLSPAVNAMSAADSFSAVLRFYNQSPDTIYQGYAVGSVQVKVVTARTVESLVATVLKSDHATASGQSVAVRPNQTYTVRVHAGTGSPLVSVSGVAVTVALSGETLSNGGKMISVNGGAATSSYPTALALTTGADGYASFTLATSGFENGNVVNVDASVGNLDAAQLVLTATTPAYSIVNDYDLYVTTPGAAVTLTYAVEDQWQVASPLTTQRLKVTRGGTGFNYAETVSTVAVVAGAAAFEFTPSPATKTGSATVTATLERFDAALNAWVAGGASDGNVTVNVTSVADAHSVAPAVSFSASVSYFPSTTSFKTVTGTVKNAGATVVVSGDASALVFRAAADKPTASGTVTVRADANGGYTFQVASLKSGEFDISINVGGSVTTSKMVVDPVADSAGHSITFDTTTIAAGSTKVITGTLVDVNGNPVNTSGSATIIVTYVPTGNAGIPIGTMPTETDKDGKFSFTVLTGPNDKGTAVVTAAYYKSGAGTAVKDVLSFTQNITVGETSTGTPASDQKLTVGSFKGFVAIYTLNYTGQKLSAKVAGRWLVQENLSRFQRVVRLTGAAIPIKVDLYIDGKFVRTENIVTK